MAFQGSLAELHLPDIIQLVSVSGKTGVFHLTDGPLHGEIWLSEGRIVHAEADDLSAEEAVYALAIWRSGEFRFEPGAAAPRHSIQKSNTNLLMEAARRLDEWRVLSKKIPSVELVPEFVIVENREGQINLNTMEWLLLSKIDGQRTVKQIAAAAGMSVFDAAKLLYGLVATNLIRLREAAPAAVAPAAPPPAPAAPPAAVAHGPTAATARSAGVTPGPAAAGAAGAQPLVARLARVRDECVALLGPVGETVVQKHYARARAELERGAGPEAIEEAIQQIARAAGILKGASVAEAVSRLGRS
jgi:pyruvate/2-oxoglutarate dehydrogenase complex dihydrolipoamide acyltransferase (E2) component